MRSDWRIRLTAMCIAVISAFVQLSVPGTGFFVGAYAEEGDPTEGENREELEELAEQGTQETSDDVVEAGNTEVKEYRDIDIKLTGEREELDITTQDLM